MPLTSKKQNNQKLFQIQQVSFLKLSFFFFIFFGGKWNKNSLTIFLVISEKIKKKSWIEQNSHWNKILESLRFPICWKIIWENETEKYHFYFSHFLLLLFHIFQFLLFSFAFAMELLCFLLFFCLRWYFFLPQLHLISNPFDQQKEGNFNNHASVDSFEIDI